MAEQKHLLGMHDPPDGLNAVEFDGWIVFTHSIGHNPFGRGGFNYRQWTDRGYGVIARLNDGYPPAIPLPQYYDEFAQRVRNWVEDSQGCNIWIIGNEMNHKQEHPDGQPITPELYAECYAKCWSRIHHLPGHMDDLVLVGATAPYNNLTAYPGNESGDWVVYHRDVMAACRDRVALLGSRVDGVALHAYTRDQNPANVSTEARMGGAFSHRYSGFRVYREFMDATPADMWPMEVHLTETNPGANPNSPWRDEDTGWMNAVIDEVAEWNRNNQDRPIKSTCFYCWPRRGDGMWMYDKPRLLDDFRRADARRVEWNQAPVQPPDPEPPTGREPFVVCVSSVNVRAEPGYSTPVAAAWYGDVLVPQDDVSVEADGLRWWSFRIDGVDGWIAEATGGGVRLLVPVSLCEVAVRQLEQPFAGEYRKTQGYGDNPGFYARWGLKGHNGWDWALPVGTPVLSVDAGRVRVSAYDPDGYGEFVVVEHSWGETIYAHLSDRWVRENGLLVERSPVGLSGNTGCSTGPHLHFGVRVNPWRHDDGWGGWCNPRVVWGRALR